MSFQNVEIYDKAVDPREYHTATFKRGELGFPASPSMLKEFMRCPRRWRDGYASPDSDAKDYGSLLDCRLLTPSHFHERFTIEPATYISTGMQCPTCGSITDSKKCSKCNMTRVEVKITKDWNNNSDTCTAWQTEQKRLGVDVVKQLDVTMCDTAITRLRSDDIIAAWLNACDTQVWVIGEWLDKATGLSITTQCLIDFVPRLDTEFAKCLGDLKSSRSGALVPFTKFCYQMGYHIQAAFDEDLYIAATGEDRNTWCLIGQENYAPWQPFRRIIVDDFKTIGRATYQQSLALYARCLSTGVWPDYDAVEDSAQGWAFVRPLPWMEFEALSNQMETAQNEQIEPEEERIDTDN